MGEFVKIATTATFTILGGVLVYVIGQLLSKFLIEPAYEFKKSIGEVRFVLAFHAQVIRTPGARTEEGSNKAHEALMKSHSDLLARAHAIPFYDTFAKLSKGFLPPKPALHDAAIQLLSLSTYVHETATNATESVKEITARIARIERNLGLESLE
jgi:hypothetical protein